MDRTPTAKWWDRQARRVWCRLITNPYHVLRRDEKAIRKLRAALRRAEFSGMVYAVNHPEEAEEIVSGKVRMP